MKKTFFLLTIAIALVLASCGSQGDYEIEKKIAGTWQAAYSETEDGVLGHLTETVRYDAESHTFSIEAKCELSYMDFNFGYFTMYANGTWYATKNEIVSNYDVDNIRLEFSRDYLENTEMSESEARSEMMKELKGELKKPQALKLNIISDNEMLQTDTDGESVTYYKQ